MTWFNFLKKKNTEAVAEEDDWEDRYFQEQQRIAALAFEEAHRQAERLLADPGTFDCVPSSRPPDGPLHELAPGLPALFSRFDSIATVDDEAFLSREKIAPFDWDGNGLSWGQPLWVIGQTHGHAATLVKPHKENVYDMSADDLLPDGRLPESGLEISYPALEVGAPLSSALVCAIVGS